MDSLRFCQPRLRKPSLRPQTSDLRLQTSDFRPQTSDFGPQIIDDGNYLVLTINRRALLADPEKLSELLSALITSSGDTPIIAPLREDARQAIEALFLPERATDNGLKSEVSSLRSEVEVLRSKLIIQPPMSYLEFGWLTAHAKGIITDSGNVAEEATFNGVPCITLNSYTEHQETVTLGTNLLVGEDPERLAQAVSQMVNGSWPKVNAQLPDRWDGRTAERIVKILLD